MTTTTETLFDTSAQADRPDETNVHQIERMASISVGMALAGAALLRRGLVGVALGLLSGAMINRGMTGHCHLYRKLRISTAYGVRAPAASVPHGQGIRVRHALAIDQTPEQLYRYWRQVENLPTFMHRLESVTALDENRSRWRLKGPAKIEWVAEIINDVENELIAWRSLPGALIPNAGSVHFEPATGGQGSIVTVILEYAPPGGLIGTTVARWLGQDPDKDIAADLQRLKQLLESPDSADPKAAEANRPTVATAGRKGETAGRPKVVAAN